MVNAKKARLDNDETQHGEQPVLISACTFREEALIELPPNLGRVSTMAIWSSREEGTDSLQAAADHSDATGSSTLELAVGTETGSIALIHNDRSVKILESNGGPAILCLLIGDTTMPLPSGAERDNRIADVISGDSDGRITVFSMGQVFSRSTLSAPISAIAKDDNPHSASSFIVGDMNGVVTACHAQDVLWRSQTKPHAASARITDPGVRAVCSVRFPDRQGILTSYVLAATGADHIQVLSRGSPVLSIPLSSTCNAMCAGFFVTTATTNSRNAHTEGERQVMLGDEAGGLFVLDSFELIPYAQIDYPVTAVASIPLKEFANRRGPDIVVCATRSNFIYVLHDRQVVGVYTAEFWPAAFDMYTTSSESKPRVAIVETRAGNEASDSVLNSVHVLSLDLVY